MDGGNLHLILTSSWDFAFSSMMNVGSKPSSISRTCDFVTNKNNMGFFIVITDISFKIMVASSMLPNVIQCSS